MTNRPIEHTSEARTVADASADAYSADRYDDWAGVAEMLLNRGYNARECEAIMRSKWTRWAADASNATYGKVPADALATFLDDNRNACGTTDAVADLVRGTFG